MTNIKPELLTADAYLPMAETKPLVVIVGETASGKSDLAMMLAQQFNGEVICADSWTVRREVNIGTAKPDELDRRRVKHHLLDVVDPCGDFTAAVFKRLALAAIDDILKRGKLPIMVGGSGLYIDGVIFDFGFLPAGDRNKRTVLNVLTVEKLQEQVVAAGLSLEGIDMHNKRRLIRLLETGGQIPTKDRLRPNTLLLGLPLQRQELKQRISRRVDHMLASGLEYEVEKLAAQYGWNCEALKGIGYREWREYFEGSQDYAQTRERIISATVGLAKRQQTWFKRNKDIQWLTDKSESVVSVATFLSKLSN